MEGKRRSKLSEHILNKKKGKVITPLNEALGGRLELNSWGYERLPEYLWIALIHSSYSRDEAFSRLGNILFEISRTEESLDYPKLSSILSLPEKRQVEIYNVIAKNVDSSILFPLTVIYRQNNYPVFCNYFYDSEFGVIERINRINEVLHRYIAPQAFESTDIRYLTLALMMFGRKIKVVRGMEILINALKEYPYTNHEEDKMELYRSSIRAMEGGIQTVNRDFIENFWKELGMITMCKPYYIVFKKDENESEEFLQDTYNALNYLVLENKEKMLTETKFEVIIGSITYTYKIFKEKYEHDLFNTIMGRHAIRTMIEVYIILKYLLKLERENDNIWMEYKMHGVSKYKLVLLKARKNREVECKHFEIPVVDAIVNEISPEEFLDIDLNYFDRLSIRKKSEEVEEKELYDLFYDYDTNYSHGLWGAVRESSLLFCDSVEHKYHKIPDLECHQIMPSIQQDTIYVMKKIMNLLSEIYSLPDWYMDKYSESDD